VARDRTGPEGHGEIVFQHGADLVLFDLATEKAKKVEVTIPGARPTLRPQAVDASKFIASASISPTGKRALFEARGDLWTAPAKEGSPRNLTRTSGVAERYPAWSPDGKWIAYSSDGTGEYQLTLTSADGKGEVRTLTHTEKSWKANPAWSPDSKWIAYSDQTGTLYLESVDGGDPIVVDKDPYAGDLLRRPRGRTTRGGSRSRAPTRTRRSPRSGSTRSSRRRSIR
jgi:tricorn protease